MRSSNLSVHSVHAALVLRVKYSLFLKIKDFNLKKFGKRPMCPHINRKFFNSTRTVGIIELNFCELCFVKTLFDFFIFKAISDHF